MDNKNVYTIAIVVDQHFGKKLLELSSRLPVWICASSQNLDFIKEIRSKNQEENEKLNITSFNFKKNDSPEEIFLGILNNVDLHHGECSHIPPWSLLEVYGIKELTRNITMCLEEYGEGCIKKIPEGFIFQRKIVK